MVRINANRTTTPNKKKSLANDLWTRGRTMGENRGEDDDVLAVIDASFSGRGRVGCR